MSQMFSSLLAWPAQHRLLKPHCRGVMRALRSRHSDQEISQSQAWTELSSQSEARVLMGEILKMITELAEIIVQRETKLRGADMKVMRAWGPVTHGDIGDTFESQ